MDKKFGVHNGKRFTLKKNGLPEGYGLYLRKVDSKEYIFAKFHGRGLSCHTTDWKQAIDFVEELRKKYEEESHYNPNLLVSDLLDAYVKHLETKNAARGDYQPATANNTSYLIKKNLKPFFGSQSLR